MSPLTKFLWMLVLLCCVLMGAIVQGCEPVWKENDEHDPIDNTLGHWDTWRN
jgi:hypothetical protein